MAKVIKEDKFGFPVERNLSEEVSEFGIPGVLSEDVALDEAARINYKGLLSDLMAAVETHMMIMAGTAEEGAEDALEAVLAATKEALEPKEGEAEGEESEEPKEEPAAE